MSKPPSEGPSAVPTADIVPSNPMALPVRCFGTVSPTSARVSAIMIAAPKPCAARAAISTVSVGAVAHSTEAAVNTASPPNMSRRRPNTSPSFPALTISVVIASRYVSTTHCASWKVASSARARVGRATLAMLVPSEANSMVSERLATGHPPGDARRWPKTAAGIWKVAIWRPAFG